MPPDNEDGVIVGMAQIGKEPVYVVTFDNNPDLQIGVKPEKILNWVSQLRFKTWEQSQLRKKLPQEDTLFTVDASDGTRSMDDKMHALPTPPNNVKSSQSTTASLAPETPPKTKNRLLTCPVRQARTIYTSASASTTAGSKAKRRRTYGAGELRNNLIEAPSSMKLPLRTNGSSIRTRSRPSSTRISSRANRKPIPKTTSQRVPSKQKRSATLASAPTDEEDDDPQYEAVKIVREEFRQDEKGKLHLYYLIEWVGDWIDTWEPVLNVGSGLIAEYKQKKHRETQMMNLDAVALSGTNHDPMRDLDDECESDKDSLFVGQGLSSSGNGIGNAKGEDIEAATSLMKMRTTEAPSVEGI